MDPRYVVQDLRGALEQKLFPTVTVWNRLEGRPRRADFDRALKAEIRDALWMLTKQWQIGEFQADDAGSPVFTKVRMRTAPVTRYRAAGGASEAFEPDVPLETKVEQRAIRWSWNGQTMVLDLRAQLGRQWGNLLREAGLAGYRGQYLSLYPFALPAQDETTDYVYAHRASWQQYAALAGRCIDGGALHLYLTGGAGRRASDGIALSAAGDGPSLDGLGVEFEAWFGRLYKQPESEDAWKPSYLEYQFECSVPRDDGEQLLTAEEYAHGRLDWYSFDVDAGALAAVPDPGEELSVSSFVPTGVVFEGMPDPRWWALEDRKTDFGAVTPSTTDIAQLLLMEFALVYADDWFLVPFRIPAATLARVEGMAVTNTFGERFWIRAADAGEQTDWSRWSMFQLASDSGSDDTSLFIPPVASKIMDSAPSDDVELARDEAANMVWAVERAIPTVGGPGRSGKDEARETRRYHERLVGATATPVAYQAPISYLAMTTVPENFIPFVPVHVDGSVREVQLQRSRMLRIIEGDPFPPEKVPPRTLIIREGLDQSPPATYFVHEEEVPRSGIRVTRSFRRTRWTGGEAYVWLGIRKTTGRGERSAGLAFDSIVDARSNG
jgi:hypothetical protein